MFNKKKIVSTSKTANQIVKVHRESVCLADDCTAPNEKEIVVMQQEDMYDVFRNVIQCLPQMNNVIWAIDSGVSILGYIIVDENYACSFDLCEDNQIFSKLKLGYLHCSYFHSRSFLYCETMDGEMLERYPMCKTMLEKVKYHMQGIFLENLKICGGCVCIWGEWFGRPYDNFHKVQSLRWEKDEIVIKFDQGESLYIKHPVIKKNEKDEFIVEYATQVLWVWYAYGSEQNYENLYVRQYSETAEGHIKRAQGKRKDVSQGDGCVISHNQSVAVIIKN